MSPRAREKCANPCAPCRSERPRSSIWISNGFLMIYSTLQRGQKLLTFSALRREKGVIGDASHYASLFCRSKSFPVICPCNVWLFLLLLVRVKWLYSQLQNYCHFTFILHVQLLIFQLQTLKYLETILFYFSIIQKEMFSKNSAFCLFFFFSSKLSAPLQLIIGKVSLGLWMRSALFNSDLSRVQIWNGQCSKICILSKVAS